jgi:hypothetical protein
MQEYKTAGQQQAEPTSTTAPRFDPRRIYTILVLAPLLYAVIRYLPPLAFSGVVILGGGLALFEFYRLCFGDRGHFWLIGIGLTGFTALILGTHWPGLIVPTLLAILVCTISVPLLSPSPLEQSLRDGAMTVFGVLYLGLTLGMCDVVNDRKICTHLSLGNRECVLCILEILTFLKIFQPNDVNFMCNPWKFHENL